ncbi:MAG TPA: M3 family oligoendopeptidase [Firmicutes bacterium]|nr:M3 family oligoendopeptidase [Bacillota bacterium]
MEKIDFEKIKSEMPDVKGYKEKLSELSKRISKTDDPKEAVEIIQEYFDLSDKISTQVNIIYIRFTQDTTNSEYEEAQKKLDEISPEISDAEQEFEKALLASKQLKAVEKKFGKLYIDMVKSSQKTFSKEIMDDLREEGLLTFKYNKLVSSAQIEFNGEKLNLPQLSKYAISNDRKVRKEASSLIHKFYEDNDKELGDIFDKLVHVRDKMAKKLGFKNYLGLGYLRLGRIDYNQKDVKKYRAQIKKNIVEVASKYRKKQIERIGIKRPKYYDYVINFSDGNPEPFGTTQEKILNAEKMYKNMSPEIGEYFTFMKEGNFLDLEARKGKSGGGYEAYIPGLKSPFIFSNFNGTSADIDVLTHEFGHALQAFLGSSYIPPYRSPGMECCEMHSMSMEYLTYPYLDMFFDEKNLRKYRYQHIIDALFFIPYGTAVDEFQEKVYENVDLTPEERKTHWRKIEKKYLPERKYGKECEFLEKGGFWYKQRHIFESPLYYIDYTIAQVVSLEFLVESEENYDKALDKYLFFSKLGGSLPYHKLLKTGGLQDPMTPGVIEDLIPKVEKIIEKYEKYLVD